MKIKYFEVFSKDEIETIHSATMELLSTVGIKIDAEDCRKLLKDQGAQVDEETNFVKFPETLIKEKIKEVPNSFELWGSDGSFHFEVNTNSTHFATLPTPVKIYDPSKKSGVRKTILEDTIKQIRIVDSLEHIDSHHLDVWPHDVPYMELHCHTIKEWGKHSHKPYGLGCYGRMASQDMMNLTSIIVGGEEELIRHPRLVGFFSTTSPLHFPQIMTNGYSIFTKYKQPTIVAPEALAGASAPVTLAGLLTQICAENIGGAILAQVLNPGAPVFFGSVSHITDMRTGNDAMGSIETGLITAGVAQLARYYNIPSRGPGACSDSKLLDLQNGIERLQTLLLAAQAGINYLTCAGTYEATLVEALELLVIDDDLVGMVKRCMEGIIVNDETIALDIITKVATSTKKGSNFLGERHTMKNMKKELYMPKLMDRNRRTTWRKKGAKDLITRAREKVDEILETQNGPGLTKDVEEKLNEYIKSVSARSFEDYQKGEGLTSSRVTIVDGVEINKE